MRGIDEKGELGEEREREGKKNRDNMREREGGGREEDKVDQEKGSDRIEE